MNDQRVTIMFSCRAKTGLESRLRQVLADLIPPSRAEDGCLNYYMHESLEDPREFMLYMNWRDEAAFNRHVATPHVQAFDKEFGAELLAEPYKVSRWRHLG
jgi:quinol monooxygenase YgiN